MSTAILRLAVSFIVVLAILSWGVSRSFTRIIVFLRRNTRASMAVADMINSMEGLERAVTAQVHNRSTLANPLPEDIQQRWARLPERFRR